MRFLASCLLLLLTGCAPATRSSVPIYTVPSGRLVWAGDLPIVILRGSPYDMGYQHGALLPREVRASVKNVMKFVDRQAGIPWVGKWRARRVLDRTWRQMAPFVPLEAKQELRGLADGARVPLRDLQRAHALPELMSATCSSFVAADQATQDGRLLHARNLDWAIQSDVQRYSALFLCRPSGRKAFVSVGWLGFIGVISGINEAGISVAEIGSETVDVNLKGIPMPFLLRQVLEESDHLEQAVRIVRTGPRTGGYNYLFADAKRKQAVALETTRQRIAVFWMGQEPAVPYSFTVPNTICRADWALDPAVRDLQRASKGNPKRPGLESPVGSKAYDVRYLGVGILLKQFHGRLDPEIALGIARAAAPSSNIQSILYAYPELWVAIASGRRPAAAGKYRYFNLERFFGASGGSTGPELAS